MDLLEGKCGQELFERDKRGRVTGGRLEVKESISLPEEAFFARVWGVEEWLQSFLTQRRFSTSEIERDPPEFSIMRSILRAMEDRSVVKICYQSRSQKAVRAISPHALARVAGRIHVRAYDHSSNDYRDFVLSRVLRIDTEEFGAEAYIGPEADKEWNDIARIIVEEKSDIPKEALSGVRSDFGLDERGRKTIRARRAVARYLVDEVKDGMESPVSIFLE